MSDPDPLALPAPVLDEACARLCGEEGEARERALAELIASNPEHRDGLQALHEALASANRVLARAFASLEPADPPHIDRYRVLRRLGEGAFGVVYLCEQREPIHRQVAVKLLRPGAGDRGTLLRFDAERRFLARLNHPAIAQILDAGLLPDGRPWFVMEYVPGVPVIQYRDRQALPVQARLLLFARLCQGVQHAHEQGIVHRDLKPANVLVVEIDGEAQPKIIDFGIAKALAQDAEPAAAATEPGRVVGTPGYMSPEQAAGRLGEVDARSDLFSLGVLLYELLTGELPWQRGSDSTTGDPPLPSRRVATGTQADTGKAQQKRLARHLRGDLDWIVLKALSRERSRRYASALELAADIHRHLRGEPVQAGPPSLAYRLRKFAYRRRTALASTLLVTLLAAFSWWLVGSYRAEARTRGQDAEAAVASLLSRANDNELLDKPGAEPLRKTLAEDALAFYDQFLRQRPDDLAAREGRARTLWTLSQVHWLVGQFARAEATAREAVDDAEAVLAAAPAKVACWRLLANAERNLGRAIFSLGRPAVAREHFQRAVGMFARCQAAEPGVWAGLYVRALLELETTLDHATEAALAEDLLRRASELQASHVRKHPDDAGERDTLAFLDLRLAGALFERGDVAAAKERLQRPAEWLAGGVELRPTTAIGVHSTLAQIVAAEGDLAAAIAHMESAVVAARTMVAGQPGQPQPLFQLATLLGMLAELQQAASLPEQRLQTCRAALEVGETWSSRFPEDPRAPEYCVLGAQCLNTLLLEAGRQSALAGSERTARLAREQLARLPQTMAPQRRLQLTWQTLGSLGLLADALGRADAGSVWEETAVAMAEYRAPGPVPAEVAAEYVMYSLRVARQHLHAGRTAEAETWLQVAGDLIGRHREASSDFDAHAPELARLRALAAVQRRAFSEAASAAESTLASDWYRAPVAAADAMSAVWRAARTGGVDPAAWRDRATVLCRQAIERLERLGPAHDDDPWAQVPLARMRILLALAQRDASAAIDPAAVQHALDVLESLRGEAHADEWDEAVSAAGKGLLAR